jgi:LPS O-antigen subunit length determinant protein (WzzB/FepE family)
MNNNIYIDDKDEIPIYDIFNLLIKKKTSIILSTTLFAVSALFYSLSLPNIYNSSAVLSTVDDSSSGSFSSITSQYSGLASMAGINLPSASGNDKSSLVIQTILSRDFLKELIDEHNFLPELIAAKRFDTNTSTLIFDEKVYVADKQKWIRKAPRNKNVIPSYLEAYEAYIKIISISKDKITGYITLSVDHVSPIFAERFLSTIIEELNTSIRNRDMKEANDSIDYLSEKLIVTKEKDILNSINQLIMTQLEKQMLVNVRSDYIVSPIDSPFIPEDKSSPKRAIICIAVTLFGFIFSCLYALIKNYTSRKTS